MVVLPTCDSDSFHALKGAGHTSRLGSEVRRNGFLPCQLGLPCGTDISAGCVLYFGFQEKPGVTSEVSEATSGSRRYSHRNV